MPDESLVIESVKNGNRNAFRKLFDDNVNQLFRFLCQFSKDKDLVEDWVQRAFIKAYNNINSFAGNSKFSTWLFSIGLNEMKNDMRKLNRYRTETIEEDLSDNVVSEVNDFEWRHDMKWLLSDLDEDKKAVFILFEVEGYSHAEISEIMDISEAASRTILCRTKNYLKEKWIKQ